MGPSIETLNLKLDVLTPLHITDGAQAEMTPLEYVITNDQQLHFFDPLRFVNCLSTSELKQFTTHAQSDNIPSVCKFLGDLWNRYPQRFSNFILCTTNAGDLARFYREMIIHQENRLYLKPFIKSSRRCFLPGSSLKGVLRTALISCLLESESLEKSKYRDSRDLEAETMWSLTLSRKGNLFADAQKDPLKALKTKDAFFQPDNSCVRQVFNIKKCEDGRFETAERRGILIFAQCITPSAHADIQITLNSRFFSFPQKSGRRFCNHEIIRACKDFHSKLLEHEKNHFFNGFSVQNPEADISSLYDQFLKINAQPNCFLLRIGRFGGKNSTSFNIYKQFGTEPVSRNLVRHEGRLIPPGWVKATVKNDQSKTGRALRDKETVCVR